MPREPWSRSDCAAAVPGGAIGMVHLAALPGSPGFAGGLAEVQQRALADAAALVEGGFGALMVENYHDIPFHAGQVPPVTLAALTVLAAELRDSFPGIPLGINVLRNDAAAALAIAAVTGASFIRVNVHVGAQVTDQGTIEGRAWHTLRLRRELDLEHVGILADLRVKHARPLAERPLTEEACDLRLRGLADGVIITGAATGSAASADDLAAVRSVLPDCPLIIGSGLAAQGLDDFFPRADAAIVGSSLKDTPVPGGLSLVCPLKARNFMDALAGAFEKGSAS